jgi:hypothetical protein
MPEYGIAEIGGPANTETPRLDQYFIRNASRDLARLRSTQLIPLVILLLPSLS